MGSWASRLHYCALLQTQKLYAHTYMYIIQQKTVN